MTAPKPSTMTPAWVVRAPDDDRYVESFASETGPFETIVFDGARWTSDPNAAHRFINREQASWVAYSVVGHVLSVDAVVTREEIEDATAARIADDIRAWADTVPDAGGRVHAKLYEAADRAERGAWRR